jgi:hypothetical protein
MSRYSMPLPLHLTLLTGLLAPYLLLQRLDTSFQLQVGFSGVWIGIVRKVLMKASSLKLMERFQSLDRKYPLHDHRKEHAEMLIFSSPSLTSILWSFSILSSLSSIESILSSTQFPYCVVIPFGPYSSSILSQTSAR